MPSVEAKNLMVVFGKFTAVNKISFTVNPGEIFGFLGANGAGKTTTIRVLCGLLVPTQGEALINGFPVNATNEKTVKSHVGYMSQKFTLYDDLTVEENLDFTAALRKIDKETYLARRRELLDFIGFNKPLNTMVKNLPGGIKQHMSLVVSLLHDPGIIFLDEPTAGVSPASRSLFWDLIRKLSKAGKTVFVTSHYMDEVEQCDRIALMRSGEIIALDSPSGLKRTTFPSPLFELTPKQPINADEIAQWSSSKVFELLTPYGMRYHATIGDSSRWEQFQKDNSDRLAIHQINPSLEDVFIRLVEGKNNER